MFLTNLNITLALRPGCVYDISIPNEEDDDYGYPPKTGSANFDGITAEYQNGFVVKNEDVGTIHFPYPDEVKVAYHHKLAMNNTIWFVSAIGHKVKFSIASVTPHDHGSMSTGGPAFGTYYTAIAEAEDV